MAAEYSWQTKSLAKSLADFSRSARLNDAMAFVVLNLAISSGLPCRFGFMSLIIVNFVKYHSVSRILPSLHHPFGNRSRWK
jgi:hypothetical protein